MAVHVSQGGTVPTGVEILFYRVLVAVVWKHLKNWWHDE